MSVRPARSALIAVLALASLGGGCITPRTEIIARFETDMAQGPTETLTAVVVRVYSDGEADPRFEQQFDLGVGTTPVLLPAELGIVPRDATNRRVLVEAEAFRGDTPLFTRRARGTFAAGQTLLLEVFLADRCRLPENRICPENFECGPTGCEAIERSVLPPFGLDAGPPDAPALDAGADTGPDARVRDAPIDAGAEDAGAEDAGAEDAGAEDAGPEDAGPVDGGPADGGCTADLTSDPLHCGACFMACPPPVSDGSATCVASTCGVACNPGFHEALGACVPIAAPRPLAPISMGRASLRAPTFVWRLAPGTDGARLEICADPMCTTVEQTLDAPGTSGAPPLALTLTPSSVHYFRLTSLDRGAVGTTRSPTWAFMIPNVPGSRTGLNASTSWPLLLDVNLDGYGDVMVGAPAASEVHVFLGSAAGLGATPSLVLSGAAGSRFGESVRAAGDVNGDGRGDVVIGAPGAAMAFVHLGSTTGLSSIGTMLVAPAGGDFGASVAAAGDVDGDGYGDVIVGAPSIARAYLYAGGPTGVGVLAPTELSGAAASSFGAAVSHAGDVDDDNFNDVIVGAPGEAAAYLFRGSASGLLVTAPARLAGPAGSRFGAAVGAGDMVTADAFADVAVGAPAITTALVFAGSATGVATTAAFTISRPEVEFGVALLVGDTDENGFEDLYVGTGANLVWSFLARSVGLGAAGGWSTINPPVPAGATGFGRSLTAVEVGRDQFVDLLIGAPGSTSAYWFAGRASGVYAAPDRALVGAASSGFGTAVAHVSVPSVRVPRRWGTPARRRRCGSFGT